jgi:hypothetical protein
VGFGRSIELYLVDGRPEGLLTAKVFNWTGQVLKVPRTQLRDALMRPEAGFTGVYVLIGEREGQALAYIGEGEEVAARIRDHDGRKDWWTDALIVTTSADELNKAHVKYLESRLVEQALSVGVSRLDNSNTPPRSSLSEASIANMEEFLDTLFIVFPALGVDMFTTKRRPNAEKGRRAEPDFTRFVTASANLNVKAFAVLKEGEFVVLKGSKVRASWVGVGDHDAGYRAQRHALETSGIIESSPVETIFTENCAFKSPSAAAAVVHGRPANGRVEWKVEGTGQTYGDWDDAQLAQVPL